MFRRWFRRPPTPAEAIDRFRQEQTALLARWFATVSSVGKPRGLRWVSHTANGNVQFAHAGPSIIAVVPLLIDFEPLPDSALADVPQAREPRLVCAVFWFRQQWDSDDRPIFNLTAETVVRQARFLSLPTD